MLGYHDSWVRGHVVAMIENLKPSTLSSYASALKCWFAAGTCLEPYTGGELAAGADGVGCNGAGINFTGSSLLGHGRRRHQPICQPSSWSSSSLCGR
mmetsp:Transcript_15277/g.30670  ORF Transcript_15277/g.30670 Transcript_15277/m.30670 type:complete len:97 (+) Transcript_15277:303-593(+)